MDHKDKIQKQQQPLVDNKIEEKFKNTSEKEWEQEWKEEFEKKQKEELENSNLFLKVLVNCLTVLVSIYTSLVGLKNKIFDFIRKR